MQLSAQQNGNITIVYISGSVDALNASDLKDFLAKQLDQGHINLILDLDKLDYTASAGVRAILTTVKSVQENGGEICLVRTQLNVYKTFELIGLPRIVEFYDDLESGLAHFA